MGDETRQMRKKGTHAMDDPRTTKPKLMFPRKYDPETFAQPINLDLVPKSDLEARLIDRFQWNTYRFNFPPRILHRNKIKMVRVMDVKLGKIVWVQQTMVMQGHKKGYLAGSAKWRANRRKYFQLYLKNLQFPKEFETSFPYLYAILRDIFYTNLVNKENLSAVQKNYDYMVETLAHVITSFWMFYRHVKRFKSVQNHFKNHPAFVPIIRDFEDLIMKITEPRDLEAKTRPDPDPPKPKKEKPKKILQVD